jgi:hypothetical protein
VRRPLETSGVLVAALVLVAGCGGSSGSSSSDETAKFKASYGSVGTQFKEISHAIGTAVEQARTQSDAQLAVKFHGLAARWQDQLSKLETLRPPANLAATFNTLNGAASRTEADLNAIVAAAETHNKSAAEQASASLVNDIESAKSASTTITP